MQIEKTIGEFISDVKVPIVGPATSVTEALALMKSHRSACVLVTQEERLVGIFTEHDFLMRVAAQKLHASDTSLQEVMTKDPDALRVEDRISYAVNLMAVGGYRNVPIVDSEGRPINNLSVYDVTSHLASIFSELHDPGDEPSEWTDIGGG
jgi:CBS domain-containing protein